MRRFPLRLLAACAATFALLAASAAWAGEDGSRPDKVADDPPQFRVLVLDRKGGPPGPIEIPKPIAPFPGGQPGPGKDGAGSFATGFSLGVPSGAGATASARIDASLKVVAQKLR